MRSSLSVRAHLLVWTYACARKLEGVNEGHCTHCHMNGHKRVNGQSSPPGQGYLEDGVRRARPGASLLRLVPSPWKCLLIAGGPRVWRQVQGKLRETARKARQLPAPRLYPKSGLAQPGSPPSPAFYPTEGSRQLWPALDSRGQRRASVWAWRSLTLFPNRSWGPGLGPNTQMGPGNGTSSQTSRSSLTSIYRESAGRGVLAKPTTFRTSPCSTVNPLSSP